MSRLLNDLSEAPTLKKKKKLLDIHPKVKEMREKCPHLFDLLSLEEEVLAKKLITIGQWRRVIGEDHPDPLTLKEFLQKLKPIDTFYEELGGIVGYQEIVTTFLNEKNEAKTSDIKAFHPPSFIDITEESEEVKEAILQGILALPQMAEMYPMGGAADRLHLVDEKTGLELPAAKLSYAGKTLLEALIRDLSAREYLYFQLYGVQIQTPVVMMSSYEKNNHQHVLAICEEFNWFGRKKELFQIFTQPLVPAVDEEGNWCLIGPYTPLLKPGGHGALWKLAFDQGIFSWLKKLGVKKTLVRQLNNPIAAIDYGLLAFSGFGVQKEMVFGFASCPRLVQSAEGVNVVVEKTNGEVALTNIEYCDFQKYGIVDLPLKEGEPYSRFSSNTNILFADLEAVEKAVKICPYPGLLVNLKDAVYTTFTGEKKKEKMARLESTMQNIADVFVEKVDAFHQRKGVMKNTYVTYNARNKTIATAKKAFVAGAAARETPEECFYIQLKSAKELLQKCKFLVPLDRSFDEYLEKGPDLLFLYHPAIGPLYSLIKQKLRGGKISVGSELQLEIASLHVENLSLDGSLLIHADQVMGHYEEGLLKFSHQTGRCSLHNVKVENEGVDWERSSPYWKNSFERKESCKIKLLGFSHFEARDVTFKGNHEFIVKENTKMIVTQKNGKLVIVEEPLVSGSFWNYQIKKERREILAVLT